MSGARRPRWWAPAVRGAIAIEVATIGLGLVLMVLDWPSSLSSGEWGFPGFQAVGAIVITASAWPILRSRPENPIGWLLLVTGVTSATQSAAHYLATSAAASTWPAPASPAVGTWLESWIWLPLVGSITVVLLIFPTGRPPSPRWRPVTWLGPLGALVGSVGFMIAYAHPPPGSARPEQYPPGTPASVVATINVGFILLIAGFALGAVALVGRARTARGLPREQLKWLALAGPVMAASLAAYLVDLSLSQDAANVLEPIAALSFLTIPVAIGIAIVRHQLFDVDRVINRTLVYAALTVVLAAVYATSVVGLGAILQGTLRTSSVVVAGSTLLVAALFQPARRRIQRSVDRRFYRGRYDTQQIAEAFSARLRDKVALEAVTGDLGHVTEETVRPTSVAVWVRPGAG